MSVMLLALAEGRPGRAIPVDMPDFVIGRDPSCQLRVDDEAVGGRHCRYPPRRPAGRRRGPDRRSAAPRSMSAPSASPRSATATASASARRGSSSSSPRRTAP